MLSRIQWLPIIQHGREQLKWPIARNPNNRPRITQMTRIINQLLSVSSVLSVVDSLRLEGGSEQPAPRRVCDHDILVQRDLRTFLIQWRARRRLKTDPETNLGDVRLVLDPGQEDR